MYLKYCRVTMPATNGQESSTGAPSDKQMIALHRFGCNIPKGLNRGDAHDWLTYLIGKKAGGEEITEDDVAHLPTPSFHPASELPAGPAAPAAPVAPVSVAPTGPIMPTSDSWVHYESVIEEVVVVGMTRRRSVKLTEHPAPGETFEQTISRLKKIAEAGLDGVSVA